MTGRNDQCPCGSGKKYKKCHGNESVFNEMVYNLPFEHGEKQVILDTFNAINADFKRNINPGACHLISAIMYILLNEQGISSELCIGEVSNHNGYFDHSWIEINGSAFDVAIQLTHDENTNAAVFAGYDLDTLNTTKNNYRFHKNGLDPHTAGRIHKLPLATYMEGADDHHGWLAIARIGKRLGLDLDHNVLKEKYKNTQRNLVSVG